MHGDIQTHLYMKNKMKKHEIEHITDMKMGADNPFELDMIFVDGEEIN